MGLAEMFGWTPVSQFIDPRRNALLGMAAGLTSGQGWSDGLGRGFAGAAQGAQVDRSVAEKAKADALAASQTSATLGWMRKTNPDLAQMVEAGMPVSQAWNIAMQRMQPQSGPAPTSDIQNYEYSLSHPGFTDFQTQKGGAAEMSLQPTWMKDANDQWFIGAQTKDGRVVKLQTPEGMSVVPPADVAGAKAGATVDAKTAAAARAALPGAQQMMEITNKAVSEVRNNAKGMNEWFGQIGPRGMYVNPGSDMAKFIAASNPTNAQAFMQARNMLKGGGQITDYEGRRAEDAMSRMQAAIDKGDQDQYLRALADFEQAVAEGYQKLVQTAQGDYGAPSQAAPAGGGTGGYRVIGVK